MKYLWRQYEHLITEHFRMLFPGAQIEHDVKRLGLYSKAERQIDILITASSAGFKTELVIDCKYFASKVDVGIVDHFIGYLGDLRASKGVIITNVGYSEAALMRAANEGRDIEVRILDFEDLESFSGFGGGFLHGDDSVVMFPCPSGWVIHPEPNPPEPLCVLSRPDVSWDDAFREREVMYLGLSSKREFPTCEDICRFQTESTLRHFPEARIDYDREPTAPFAPKTDRKIYLRRIDFKEYPEPEVTVFVEFEDFFFYTVLLAPAAQMERSLKKLAFLAKMVIPAKCIIGSG